MKKLIAALLTLMLVLSCAILPAAAYTDSQLNTADALYHLGLFLGTGETYALDENLTREQGMVLLVRMLGMEAEVQKGGYSHPFTDVPEWVSGYVGYAYEKGITNGVSATEFGSSLPMTDQMFLTLCLRAIGYSDIAGSSDYTYDDVWSFAAKQKLIPANRKDTDFTRGDTVEVFWTLLNLRMKGSTKTLARHLADQGVFSLTAWNRAVEIRRYGRNASEGTGESGQQQPGTTGQEGSDLPGDHKPSSDLETPLF